MTLGKEELKHIFEEEKEIEAECQFCGKNIITEMTLKIY